MHNRIREPFRRAASGAIFGGSSRSRRHLRTLMQEPSNETSGKTRSLPRSAFVFIRCLHCDYRSSFDGRSLLDPDVRNFLLSVFEHTTTTTHKCEITCTETFYVETLR